ncbi:MAG: M1 family peptidase [Promethearchaeota archaeon]|nr:MAG: M1 family peptidase [Candidatus Lokiarchaeota archaeon]
MKKKYHKFSCLLIGIFVINCVFSSVYAFNSKFQKNNYISSMGGYSIEKVNDYPKLAQISGNFLSYNLSVILDEVSSSVEGNLTVNFYNNDIVNLTQIPFHIYLSGMECDIRPGLIEIVNVTDLYNPNLAIPFEVYSNQQIMWVNLTANLEPQKRAEFLINFNAIIPDGGVDRSNSHGSNATQSRIFKFASFYPIPCVYDNKDGWNIDPYLTTGDPFYFDMAYYNFFVEAPNGMKIAATGNLEEKLENSVSTWYHFNPIYPVREVTFSASRYFQVQSKISNGVNISTYFLPKDGYLWSNYALNHAENAPILFNNTFGTYPYPTLNVVEEYTDYGGMEYPLQVYISEAIDSWGYPLIVDIMLLEKLIVHEVCHQWWYNLVGNDEVDLGFLDEGLTCWSTDYYGEYYYGDWEYFQTTRYIDRVRTYYAETGLGSKINQSAYEYTSTGTDWIYVCYYKTPLILEKLRRTIGHENFINGLKLYHEQYKFDHAILSDLQNSFESIIGESLDWFFLPWFDNPYLPKYAFDSHSFNPDTLEFQLSISDINVHMHNGQPPLNQYSYSQEVRLLIYGTNNNQIIWDQTLTLKAGNAYSMVLSETPYRVELLYNDYVLVQLDDPLDSTLVLLMNTLPFIPGYDLGPFLLFTVLTIGIIIFLVKKKELY